MFVNTSAVSFPSRVEGAAAIAQVLVSRFNQHYENIYTFCLGEPPANGATAHTCKWLVGMSVKETARCVWAVVNITGSSIRCPGWRCS